MQPVLHRGYMVRSLPGSLLQVLIKLLATRQHHLVVSARQLRLHLAAARRPCSSGTARRRLLPCVLCAACRRVCRHGACDAWWHDYGRGAPGSTTEWRWRRADGAGAGASSGSTCEDGMGVGGPVGTQPGSSAGRALNALSTPTPRH